MGRPMKFCQTSVYWRFTLASRATPSLPLRIRDLAVNYGAGDVVHELDLDVEAGAIVALLGPNGAGKSSTLAAIAGRIPAARGSIELGGVVVTKHTVDQRARKGLVLVPEERGLIPSMSVYDHLRLGGHGRPTAEQLSQTFALFPHLREVASRAAGLLSGGEARMLSIASVLATRPKVLLLDELSLGLAPSIVKDLLARCRDIATADGISIVLVEQFVDQVATVADYVHVLSGGSVQLAGGPEILADREALHRAYTGVSGGAG